jgi:hypothetical protein
MANQTVHVKPCRNCGADILDHPSDETEVHCDCGESMDYEEWQDDNARERILRTVIEKLRVEKAGLVKRLDLACNALLVSSGIYLVVLLAVLGWAFSLSGVERLNQPVVGQASSPVEKPAPDAMKEGKTGGR